MKIIPINYCLLVLLCLFGMSQLQAQDRPEFTPGEPLSRTTPCPISYSFVSPADDISTPAPIFYEADLSIEASNSIGPGTSVKYDAGEYILLKNGFFAQAGTTFLAHIDGCGPIQLTHGDDYEPDFELAPLSRPTEDQKATTAAASNMLQAAPNPFTASTALTYTLAAPTIVRLELYDNTGRLVRILQDGMLQAADTYQMDMAGEALAPGVYYCRMTAGEQVQVLKLVRAGL